MLVNVYDFDKTIYKHDSGVDFYFFCLKKFPIKVLKTTFNGNKKFTGRKTLEYS